jgi:hypothetical protein
VEENELNKPDFGKKLRFLRKIVEVQPICPVNVFFLSTTKERRVTLNLTIFFKGKFSIKNKRKTNR